MNPQEQNKEKTPNQGQNKEASKQAAPGVSGAKPTDKKDDGSCSTTKGSCGTK